MKNYKLKKVKYLDTKPKQFARKLSKLEDKGWDYIETLKTVSVAAKNGYIQNCHVLLKRKIQK